MNIETKYEKQFKQFLDCLHKADCMEYVIVVGSWAEYLYAKSNILDGYEPDVKTLDADFLVPNLRKPRGESNLVMIAKEAGFVYSEDSMTGASKFIGDELFEVEFLIAQKGDGTRRLPRTNLGVNAQQLTHLEVLGKFVTKAKIDQYHVLVPIPEAYTIQKMVINHRRKIKATSDKIKIDKLLPYLDEDKLNMVYNFLTNKEKLCCNAYIKDNCPEILLNDSGIKLKPI